MRAAPRPCTFSERHGGSALPTAFLQVLVDGRDQAIELDLLLIEQVQIIQIPGQMHKPEPVPETRQGNGVIREESHIMSVPDRRDIAQSKLTQV